MEDCIFCQIVEGKAPAHLIWEDDSHMAFLSSHPNTEGFSVVIPREHYSSYAFDLPDQILTDLTLAAKQVGKLLDKKFEDVGRTAMVYEGFGVNHIHAKLIPLHGTNQEDWEPIVSNSDEYFEKYLGYIATHDSKPASQEELAKLAEFIREE